MYVYVAQLCTPRDTFPSFSPFFFPLPFISLLLFNFSNFPLRMVVVFTVFTYEVVFFFHWFLSGGKS